MNNRTFKSLVLVTALAGFAGTACASSASVNNPSCVEETRMATIWNPGPRPSPQARVEKRIVTVCDGKVVKQVSAQVARQDKE